MNRLRCLLLPLCSCCVIAAIVCIRESEAQTVINVPPSPSPASAGADTIINVLPGGTLTNFFQANDGSTVNILGGTTSTTIGNGGSAINMQLGRAINLIAYPGAVLNISGGLVTGQVQAESVVNVSGGRLTFVVDFAPTADINISWGAIERLQAQESTVTLSGLDFKINGVAVAGLLTAGDRATISLTPDTVLTGVLADGRAFAHYHAQHETDPFVVEFVRSATPVPPTPSSVQIVNESSVEWIGDQQSVAVMGGGTLVEHFRAGPGSRIDVQGGRIREAFHAVSAEVELSSGSIGRRSKYFDNTTVNVHGGLLEDDARFFAGSTLNVFGGEVAGASIRAGATANFHGGDHYRIGADKQGTVNFHGGEVNYLGADDGTLNIYGGRIVDGLEASGANVNIYGGSFSDIFNPRLGSQLTLHATELRRNGVLLSGLQNVGDTQTIGTLKGDILSGVFADGTPFVLGGEEYDLPSTVNLTKSAAYTPGPALIHVPTDAAPQGIHSGQTLILDDGGALPIHFTASHGSHVDIRGGTVGYNFEAIGAAVDISGGHVSTLDAFSGATINISGDAEWGGLEVFQGATANISGGLGNGLDWYRARTGSMLNITGGEMRGSLEAEGANVNISGGLHRGMVLFHDGDATISGGEFSQGISVMSGSQLLATGGTLTGISTSLGDSDLSGIAHTEAIVDGAKVQSLRANDESEIEVRKGVVGDTDAVGGKLIFRGGTLGDRHQWVEGEVELHGYDFQFNGVPIAGLDAEGQSLVWNGGANLTGTLADGTPFNLFANDNSQAFIMNNGVLKLIRSATPSLLTNVVVPSGPALYGASAGQTVILQEGGALDDNFLSGHDSVVEIHGGSVGDNFEAERSEVFMTGGVVGNRWDVFGGAKVVVTGGTLGNEFEIHAGGTLELENGVVGSQGQARGGTVNMSGGTVGHSFDALAGSTVNISGGTVGSGFSALAGSKVYISGGTLGAQLEAASGSEVYISGGRIGSSADARSGSKVLISGGNILDDLFAEAGSNVDLSGGNLGDSFSVHSMSNFVIHGMDFEIDGTPVSGLDASGATVAVSIPQNQLFTGTLSDGTPFSFESNGVRQAKLVRAADLPGGPSEIHVPSVSAPGGVRIGQHLTLDAGGSLDENFTAGRGSTVTVLGGNVASNLEAYHAIVNVAGGTIGNEMDAFAGAQINLSAGKIGANLEVYRDAEVNVSGGVALGVRALAGSKTRLSGGQITNLNAANSSQTTWNGGSIGMLNVSGAESTIAIHGVGFELNGVPVAGLANVGNTRQIDLPANSFLTAILADGTPLLLNAGFNSPIANAQIANGVLTLVRSDEPAMPEPAFQVINDANAPFAMGEGQFVQVVPGGQLPGYFLAGPNSHLQLLGGAIGSNLKAWGGKFEVLGGTIGTGFVGLDGLELTIQGGSIANGMTLLSGAHVDISGGLVPAPNGVDAGVEIEIYGTSFLLNNQSIPGLQRPGDSVIVTARGGQMLNGILADGSALSWRLSPATQARGLIGFSEQALLRVHFVPEPSSVVILVSFIAGVLLRRPVRRTMEQDLETSKLAMPALRTWAYGARG